MTDVQELIERLTATNQFFPNADVCTEEVVKTLQQMAAEIERLNSEREALKQQAQIWKMEAQAHKATVHEAYRVCTGNTGEPGDWNGAEPIRQLAAERDALRAEIERLRDDAAENRRWHESVIDERDALNQLGRRLYAAMKLNATHPQATEPAPKPTVPDNMQDWKDMDGTTAWHLIERHADNWADVGKMMDEWLAANQQAQPAPSTRLQQAEADMAQAMRDGINVHGAMAALIAAQTEPAPSTAGECDTPHYCKSVLRCTALDEARAQPAQGERAEVIALLKQGSAISRDRGINLDFAKIADRAAALLQSAPSQTGRALTDGQELWLWRNGDHMLAFEHLYPCFTPGGDPMTLGEPSGKAVFKVSYDRASGG